MNNFIYEKLAVTNLKNNRKTYVPYIFTGVLTVMMFYIIDALSKGEGITQNTLKICLQYATGVIIVFANAEQIERIESFSYADKFNLKGDDGKQKETLEQIQNEFYEKFPDGTMESRMLSRSSFYELYGGLFFIGIYLGSMFIMATVLIIYYKQISEGYDDRERYQIMQKVGMSKKEVKRSIRSQVLSVFFLPLVVAAIHVAVAFKVMTKILGVLNLTNVSLFAVCTIITIAVFAVFYIIVYSITAKEYYRIVN